MRALDLDRKSASVRVVHSVYDSFEKLARKLIDYDTELWRIHGYSSDVARINFLLITVPIGKVMGKRPVWNGLARLLGTRRTSNGIGRIVKIVPKYGGSLKCDVAIWVTK